MGDKMIELFTDEDSYNVDLSIISRETLNEIIIWLLEKYYASTINRCGHNCFYEVDEELKDLFLKDFVRR